MYSPVLAVSWTKPLSQPTTTVRPSRNASGRTVRTSTWCPLFPRLASCERDPSAPVKCAARRPVIPAGRTMCAPAASMGHGPLVAGDIPVQLVVIVENRRPFGNGVVD